MMSIRRFKELFRSLFHRGSRKPTAMAFVDYEYWFYTYKNLLNLEPNTMSWRQELDDNYNVLDILVFAEFSNNKYLNNQITPLRNITNTIIETYQQTGTRKKDMTDFIMLDYIYQTAVTRKDVDVFILFTGDGHFHSVVKYLIHTLKKKVVVYAIKGSLSTQLKAVASEVRIPPDEDTTFKQYAPYIVEDLAYASKSSKIIPTFNSTIKAVLRNHKEASEESVRYTLQKMLDDGLVVQRLQRVEFNHQVKVLFAEWDKLHAIGLWDYENG